jgi:predicted MPP superfamily phosphohydrolase
MDLLRVEGLQVRYPIHREPSIKDVSFTMKKGTSTMYISRGLGNCIIPIRIFNCPEIVAVTLKDNE